MSSCGENCPPDFTVSFTEKTINIFHPYQMKYLTHFPLDYDYGNVDLRLKFEQREKDSISGKIYLCSASMDIKIQGKFTAKIVQNVPEPK